MILVAILLVAAGGISVARRARHRTHLDEALAHEFLDLVEFVAAAVTVGVAPMEAVAMHAEITGGAAGTGDAVRAWREGQSTAESLTHVEARCGTRARNWCEALSTAASDGLPLTAVLARLADEARRVREHADEEAVARLPVRLAVPLVVCVLPSYVLLGAIPIMAFARRAFG